MKKILLLVLLTYQIGYGQTSSATFDCDSVFDEKDNYRKGYSHFEVNENDGKITISLKIEKRSFSFISNETELDTTENIIYVMSKKEDFAAFHFDNHMVYYRDLVYYSCIIIKKDENGEYYW